MVDDAFTPIDKTVISTAVEEFDVGASLRLSNRNVCIEYQFGNLHNAYSLSCHNKYW